MSDLSLLPLASCPGCGEDVEPTYEEDLVCLECLGCGTRYGAWLPRYLAREMCDWWNKLLGSACA